VILSSLKPFSLASTLPVVETMHKSNLTKLFTLLPLVLCSLSAASLNAQEPVKPEVESDKATLFWDSKKDSRGPRWDLSEEPGVFLYTEQLRIKRPHDKVVYIAYGSLGEVAWYLLSIKDWLNNRGGVGEDSIFTFDGGRENELRYEAWLVPEGAKMPKIIGPPAEDENAVIKFTDYPYETACEYCSYKGGMTLEALVEALKKRPQRKAYLEFYGCGRKGRGRFSVARHEELEAKRILIKQGGIAPSRVLVKIKENSKQRCEASIWLLPPHLNSLTKQRK
jgi:hypothetical protein